MVESRVPVGNLKKGIPPLDAPKICCEVLPLFSLFGNHARRICVAAARFHRMRRPPRHLVLILFVSVTLAVLGCVSPFRRNAPGAGREDTTGAPAPASAVIAGVVELRAQQEEKEDGHDGKETPASEEKRDAREPTAPPPGTATPPGGWTQENYPAASGLSFGCSLGVG